MKARLPQGMGGGPSNMNQMIRQALYILCCPTNSN